MFGTDKNGHLLFIKSVYIAFILSLKYSCLHCFFFLFFLVCPSQVVGRGSAPPWAEPDCVTSQANTTASPVTAATPPLSPHAWCITGTCLSERWVKPQFDVLHDHIKLMQLQ